MGCPLVDSLSSLIPDIVVEDSDSTFVFDAKYKGYLEEVDDLRLRNMSEMLREDHRHDLHQVLAYSSMYQSENLTVALVYPLLLETWSQLNHRGISVMRGKLDGPDRQINLALIGVPIEMEHWSTLSYVTDAWETLRQSTWE